jgi:hypothetical protein
MNNLDFFQEYENYKRKTQSIFESLDKKINSKKNELNEALFGLIKTAKDREKEIKDIFFDLPNDEDVKDYSIDLGSKNFVKIENATNDDLEQAWEILRTEIEKDGFKGKLWFNANGLLSYHTADEVKKNEKQPNNQQQDSLPAYKITYDKKNNRYLFGSPDRYVTKISNALSELQTYNWEKSPLKYLFEDPLKFGLREIVFDFKEAKISAVRDGFWNGNFAGGLFEADFVGNSFKGRFFSNNEDWKSKPTAFVSGTFTDKSKTGILGLKDVKQGNENYAFHLIQLPPSYSIEVLTDKQLRHTITCEKRMDTSNSNFVYSVYMGYDIDQVSPKSIVLPWENIRAYYNSYKVSGKMKSLLNLFSLESDESIIELRIVEAGTPPSFKKKEKFDDKKEYIENTSNLRGLKQISGSQYNRNLNFDITSDSDFENFNKIKGYINSNQFQSDLKKASVYLDNKLISTQEIKNKFPYLVNVFTSDVISEAGVNLANPKKNYGKQTYNTRSGKIKNPLTGKNFEQSYEISDYLNQKYKAEIEANGGRKPDAYQKEYQKLYDAVFNSKSNVYSSASIGSESSTQLSSANKEEDVVLKRIENFVKYFVYKIDDGKNTNKIRKFFIDLLKSKITAHKELSKASQPTSQPTAQPTAQPTVQPIAQPIAQPVSKKGSAPKSPKKGGVGGAIKENLIRLEIRKILGNIL